MRRLPTTLLALALAVPPKAHSQPTGIVTLHSLRHQARVLLIFAPRPDDAQLEIQIRTLNEHMQAATERDLVPIALPYNNPGPTAATVTAEEAISIRRRFNIAPTDFAVILIGKDGGEKLRSAMPLSIDKLSSTIDAMPMRQEEIRARP